VTRRRLLSSALGALASVLLAVGLLAGAFSAYQLFGTGLGERQSQRSLRREVASDVVGHGNGAASATGLTLADLAEGTAVAVIQIPRIALTKVVVEGVGLDDLRRGPGHYPGTPLPGGHGNVAIAGHRTTYGAPFYRADDLQAGDDIFLTGASGSFRYRVMAKQVVSPTDVAVVGPTSDDRLTLTTCHPRFSAAKRLIISAGLVGPAPDAAPPWLKDGGRGLAGGGVTATNVSASSAAAGLADGQGGGTGGSWPVTAAWAGALGLLWVATRRLGALWRRLPTYLLASPGLLALTWVFFSHLERVLPASY
jgi:sortase A